MKDSFKTALAVATLVLLNLIVPQNGMPCDTDYDCQMRCYWACDQMYDPDSADLKQCQLYCEDIFAERIDNQEMNDYLEYLDAKEDWLLGD